MSGWRLRALGLGDLEAAARLHAACFPDQPWDARSLESSLRGPGVFGFTAFCEDEPKGLALFRHIGEDAEVLTICSAPDCRRQGVARALLSAALGLLTHTPARQLFLEVAADNEAAQSLYRGLGFEEAGRRKDYYRRPEGRCDALILRLNILKDEE